MASEQSLAQAIIQAVVEAAKTEIMALKEVETLAKTTIPTPSNTRNR